MEKIFKWFTLANERLALVRIAWFVERFEYTEFTGIDRLICLFLKYCADLDIPALKNYLTSFMETEGKKLIKKHSIRLDTMENFNYNEPSSLEEAFRIISTSMYATYDSYCQQDLSNRSFKVDMDGFMSTQKAERFQAALVDSFTRMSNGDDVDEIMEDTNARIMQTQEVYDKQHLEKLDFMTGESAGSRGAEIQRFLYSTGIPCIDGDIGGMYSRMVWSFTGSPGSGKTRAAVAWHAYRAAVFYKLDVLFDELELTQMEVQNMLIAHHITHLYKGNVKIADSDMNKNRLSPEQKRYYEAAKMDLFESGKYGKITIRTEGLVVEKMEREAYTFLRHNRNTQLWIIDYAGLIKSKPVGKYVKHLEQHEIIDEAYRITKSVAKVADIGVLMLNQFNEKGIAAAQAGKRIVSGYVQGGQAIARHADYDIAMCMTEEQELANMRTLSTVKKRAAKGFQNVPFNTDLSVSIFRQIQQQATS